MDNQFYMKRCLDLAYRERGNVSPNPMVGAVIVSNEGEILGEGAHEKYGEAHAEVNAFSSIPKDRDLSSATLFISLEPCSFHGKTPPCTDAILKSGIRKVVVGMSDPNPKVSGEGFQILRSEGIEVQTGILEPQAHFLNRRFITNQNESRPYVILKWAETADRFIARSDGSSKWISSKESRALVHRWRTEEDGILVGTTTAVVDNPELTARIDGGDLLHEKQPVRIFIDRSGKVPGTHNLFSGSTETLCFTESETSQEGVESIPIGFDKELWPNLLKELYNRDIGSLIVEGGAATLNSLIEENLWDEARVFRSEEKFDEGIQAPTLEAKPFTPSSGNSDALEVYLRKSGEFFVEYL